MFNRVEPNQYTRTYATVERLNAALEKYGISDFRHVLTYTKEGRVTAIFIGREQGSPQLAHLGFMVAF